MTEKKEDINENGAQTDQKQQNPIRQPPKITHSATQHMLCGFICGFALKVFLSVEFMLKNVLAFL